MSRKSLECLCSRSSKLLKVAVVLTVDVCEADVGCLRATGLRSPTRSSDVAFAVLAGGSCLSGDRVLEGGLAGYFVLSMLEILVWLGFVVYDPRLPLAVDVPPFLDTATIDIADDGRGLGLGLYIISESRLDSESTGKISSL